MAMDGDWLSKGWQSTQPLSMLASGTELIL
jgi:hypothetical protein